MKRMSGRRVRPRDGGETSQTSSTSQSQSQSQTQSGSQNAGSSQSQQRRQAPPADIEEFNNRVNDLVQFFLVMDQRKIPIKKADINKVVLREFAKSHFSLALEKAAEKLKNVFGLKVVELQDKNKGTFILVNSLSPPADRDRSVLVWSEEENQKMGLLMVILSLIFMSDNVMSDDDLWHALVGVGINPQEPHETFGDVKKLITGDFVRQGYLEHLKIPNTDPTTYEFRWGQRASCETSKRKVLQFVSEIYTNSMDSWTSRWNQVRDEEARVA